MPAAPWFPLYVKDWLVGTAAMTDEQAGAYMRLLCHAWDANGLPDDEQDIRAIGRWSPAAWKRIWPVVGSKFPKSSSGRKNVRQEAERLKTAERSEIARKKVQKRWSQYASSNTAVIPQQYDPQSQSHVQRSRSKKISSEPASPASEPEASQALEPVVLTFPTVGTGPASWGLTEAQRTEWAGAFPDLDIERQCKAALAWVLAKPSRRKTAKGMPAFLVGWLGRSTDNGHAPTNGARAAPVTFSAQAEADTRAGLAEYRRRQQRAQETPDALPPAAPAGGIRIADLGLGALVRRIGER